MILPDCWFVFLLRYRHLPTGFSVQELEPSFRRQLASPFSELLLVRRAAVLHWRRFLSLQQNCMGLA
jgi:hypothetical protein